MTVYDQSETSTAVSTAVEDVSTDDIVVERSGTSERKTFWKSAGEVAGTAAGLAAAGTSALGADNAISDPIFTCAVPIDGPSAANRLANKATFGYTQEVEKTISAMGHQKWLEDQIDYKNVSGFTAFEAGISAKYPQIDYFFYNAGLCSDSLSSLRNSLIKARVDRAVGSPAQLYERMVEFWTDHFSTWHFTANISRLKILEDRDVIRANVFGKLSEMLYGVAISPAMLVYLDGNKNVKTTPNENFAREFLELHTLGVDNCYDEGTIQVLAKALTGWKVGGSSHHCGEVWWDDNDHDMTAKSLVFPGCSYTFNIAAGMATDLELSEVVFMLTDPGELGEKTVKFIAKRMAQEFLKCNPPKRLIAEMWAVYQRAYSNGTNDIAAMVSVLFSKNWINCSRRIFKRPLHLMASSVRGLGVNITNPGNESQTGYLVGGFLTATGHRPFNWPAPDGYPRPCDEDYWGGNQLERWNLGADMLEPGSGITGVDKTAVLSKIQGLATNQEVVNWLDNNLFGGFMNAVEKSDILNYINTSLNQANAREEALGLAITSPGFQWY